MGGNLLSALGMLSMTILILILAYWTSRWVGVHGAPGGSGWPGGMGTDNFRIVARLGAGRNAALLIVRAGERCLLLGVTEHEITLLKEWEGEEAEAWLTEAAPDDGFLNVLRESVRRRTRSERRNK